MKFTQYAIAAFLAIASAAAVPHQNPEAIAAFEAFCNSPGQPCHKVKRVAEALAEPVASEQLDAEKPEADSIGKRKWCWMPGESCVKAKRQLEELEAVFRTL